jgi:hypothetical protein
MLQHLRKTTDQPSKHINYPLNIGFQFAYPFCADVQSCYGPPNDCVKILAVFVVSEVLWPSKSFGGYTAIVCPKDEHGTIVLTPSADVFDTDSTDAEYVK